MKPCDVLRETRESPDLPDRKERRAETRPMNLCPGLRELKETEACRVNLDARGLLAARDTKESKETRGRWVPVEIWAGRVLTG